MQQHVRLIHQSRQYFINRQPTEAARWINNGVMSAKRLAQRGKKPRRAEPEPTWGLQGRGKQAGARPADVLGLRMELNDRESDQAETGAWDGSRKRGKGRGGDRDLTDEETYSRAQRISGEIPPWDLVFWIQRLRIPLPVCEYYYP